MALKLPRTIRLDPSDMFVFDPAADAGEWAVSGAFMFWDRDPARLAGKEQAAFRSGLLGVASWGWSTLAIVTEASEDERAAAVELLAAHLQSRLGAPDRTTALTAARQEIEFAASLCDHPVQTLIAVHRIWDGEDIREQFRTLRPRVGGGQKVQHDRIFAFLKVDESDAVADEVNIVDLARGQRSP